MTNLTLEDTVEAMNSSLYQDRFRAEYFQTKIRYEKLKSFNTRIEAANALKFGRINPAPNSEIEDLEEPYYNSPPEVLRDQQRIMGEYLHLLELRAVLENIYLGEESFWEKKTDDKN